jgi:hypothetical protein
MCISLNVILYISRSNWLRFGDGFSPHFQQGIFASAPCPGSRAAQPAIQWVMLSFFAGLKWLENAANTLFLGKT